MVRPFGITGCTSNGASAFVGGGLANIAGGQSSGVLAGNNNESCADQSGIGAGNGNTVEPSNGSQLNDYSFIAAGFENTINAGEAFIGAGFNQNILGAGSDQAIVGGDNNQIGTLNQASYSFIGGGLGNTLNGEYAVIGGGQSNSAPAEWSALVGGESNQTASNDSFIGGGAMNLITPFKGGLPNGGNYAVIAGGLANSIDSGSANGGEYAAIGGGESNTALGFGANIPGGRMNSANGADSFAAGTNSWAANNGAWVWSDDASSAKQLKSAAPNVFLARASGGFTLYTNPALTTGVMLGPGSGTWAMLSDRSVKDDITSIDDQSMLDLVARLPISEWSYIGEPGHVRHVGPMAQDFYAAFAVGADNRHITSIDEDGVALAAIKGLDERLQQRDREIRDLRGQVDSLARAVARLEHQMR